MSPHSVLKVAEATAGRATANGPDADWVWSRLGYGCALAAAGTAAGQVDAWQAGQEPCARPAPFRHRPPQAGTRRRLPVAGVVRQVRPRPGGVHGGHHRHLARQPAGRPAAGARWMTATASPTGSPWRSSSCAAATCWSSTRSTPSSGPPWSRPGGACCWTRPAAPTLRCAALDTEFGAAFGRVHDDVDASVRDACSATRFLSENYVSHLAYGRLGTSNPDTRRRPGPSRHWVVPRRWDAWLTARLFGLDDDRPGHRQAARHVRAPCSVAGNPLTDEPAVFRQIRPFLRAVISTGPEGRAISDIRAEPGPPAGGHRHQ